MLNLKRIALATSLLIFQSTTNAADFVYSADQVCSDSQLQTLLASYYAIDKAEKIINKEELDGLKQTDRLVWVDNAAKFPVADLAKLVSGDQHQVLLLDKAATEYRSERWLLGEHSINVLYSNCELPEGIEQTFAGIRTFLNKPELTLSPEMQVLDLLGQDIFKQHALITRLAKLQGKFPPEVDSDFSVQNLHQAIDAAPLRSESTVKSRGQEKNAQQAIYFATNRARSEEEGDFFSGKRSLREELTYGQAVVSFPANHQRFQIETPLLSLKLFSDPDEHVLIKSVDAMSRKAFFDAVNNHPKSGDEPWGDSIIVYIHGFNVSFNNAVLRTAQLAFDYQYAGVPLLFSWPSDGELTAYASDREDATWSISYLAKLLKDIQQKNPDTAIHLIAHSMGNQVLLGAMQKLVLENPGASKWFRSAVLAAPDFDQQLFAYQLSSQIIPLVENWAVYASENDTALIVSRKVNSVARLGQPHVSVMGIDMVDASSLDVDLWSVPQTHSYYATQQPVADDIAQMLQGVPAEERDMLEPFDLKGSSIWRIIEE